MKEDKKRYNSSGVRIQAVSVDNVNWDDYDTVASTGVPITKQIREFFENKANEIRATKKK